MNNENIIYDPEWEETLLQALGGNIVLSFLTWASIVPVAILLNPDNPWFWVLLILIGLVNGLLGASRYDLRQRLWIYSVMSGNLSYEDAKKIIYKGKKNGK